ncbi:MAG: RagB/SusD family nutrient uptake outer membrane protein [Dysgonamonadaceae bacterium]|jgi:hypothetical protein|nr:RagB/SusD family nutrient uptake outer membrane protein [Dysgonamonadaceae bacterium]
MNKFKKIIICLVVAGLTTTSCSDFLEETLETQRSTEYFNTPEGLKELGAGLYYGLRFHFAYEWSFATTNYGVDEFRVGGDASNHMWNSYDGSFTSLVTAVNVNTVMANTLWDNMYTNINTANTIIEKAPTVLSDMNDQNLLMGEAYFMRAFDYFKLVKQYGGVPLKLTPSTSVEREFERNTAEDCVAQIISDFEEAYKSLPANPGMPGKLTKSAAAHFLAKAYLFRASEINDSWNTTTKNADLSRVIALADEVIAKHQLAPNFSDLWNYTEPDGPNEQLSEIILAAQFTSASASRGKYANQVHLYYLSQYLNLPHMMRDIAGGREYQRLRTNYYAYDVYDRVNDSRFWKSFKTKYAVNSPTSTAYEKGDLSIIYIINDPGDPRFPSTEAAASLTDTKTGKLIPSVFIRYLTDGTPVLSQNQYQNRFASLNKYIDGSREAVGDGMGYRDGILARASEAYLLAAEALIRLNRYSDAFSYINKLRSRAAYKEGEDRAAYCDGGAAYNSSANPSGYASFGTTNSYYKENSYYESNNISKTTAATNLEVNSASQLPAADEKIIADLGYTDEYNRMMCFLLNERSRELMGEFHRWEDLSRTKTLVARAKAYNPEASPNVKDYHCLRPIPQSYLDVIQRGGKALTADEKKAMQNPGY